MIRHGLISNVDAGTIRKTIDRVLGEFQDCVIYTCEVGILDGSTSVGIHDYILSKNRRNKHVAIDNAQYQEIVRPFDECEFILGDSKYVYNQLPDSSQNFIFVDANHNFPSVIADFFCYSRKVCVGGYIGFHDTAPHIQDFLDYQWFGDKNDKDMYICVRRALKVIGLIDNKFPNWELAFDECDTADTAGGVVILKRLA